VKKHTRRYFSNSQRRKITPGVFVFAGLLLPATVLACPVCFGVDEGPVADGVRTAVLVLVGVTFAVLAGFGVFITRFVRRSRAAAGPRPGTGSLETVENRPDPLCR
jgi:hypothetical protein